VHIRPRVLLVCADARRACVVCCFGQRVMQDFGYKADSSSPKAAATSPGAPQVALPTAPYSSRAPLTLMLVVAFGVEPGPWERDRGRKSAAVAQGPQVSVATVSGDDH
jgi:hypothetical protein